MKKLAVAALLLAVSAAPLAAMASTVDPAMIPDGTYVVKVEKVEDASHLLVMMQNGIETTLISKSSFNAVKANDTLKVSLIKGIVPVYQVQ